MGSTKINGYRYPEGTDQPVVAQHLKTGLDDASQGSMMRFANATERTAVFGALGVTPTAGMVSYVADAARYDFWTSAAWGPAPGQLVARGRRTSDKVFSGTEVGVLELDDIPVYANVAYLISSSPLRFQVAATDTAQSNLRYTTDGSTPNATSSTVMTVVEGGNNVSFQPAFTQVFNVVYVPAADQTLSLLITLSRSGGASNVTMNGTSTRPIDMYVWSLGRDPGNTGVSI